MKLLTLLVLIFSIGGVIPKTVKKSTEDAAATTKSNKSIKDVKIEVEPKKSKSTKLKLHPVKKTPPPAIIAIEIIDPNDNSTKSKNSKRTIQSALGYGIPTPNSYGVTDKPKLVFYKYSQQDILPVQNQYQSTPYQGYDSQHRNLQGYNLQDSQGLKQTNLQIQKAVRYDLGSTQHVEYSKPNVPNYEPTTLFATFNQQGHVGGFTQNVPQQGHNAPVILLRVYTNQLGGAIYPNLPASHPYAGLNNINLQNMLNKFFDKHFYQQQSDEQYQEGQLSSGYQQNYYPNQQSNYQQVQHQAQQQYYIQPQVQGHDYYLNQPNQYHQQYQDDINQYQYNQQSYDYDNLPTHENYPSNAHTRIAFDPNKVSGKDEIQRPQVLPTKISTNVRPQSYSSFELRNPHQDPDYTNYPPQDYTIKQNQDDQGYYYYKPEVQQQIQNYQKQLQNYQNTQGIYQTHEDYKTGQQDYQGSQQEYQEPQQNYQGLQQTYRGSQQDYQGSQNGYQTQQDYQEPQHDYDESQQGYQSTEQEYKTIQQNSGSLNEKRPVDTQKVPTPHNYHAHPATTKTTQKRTITRLENIRRINTSKKKE